MQKRGIKWVSCVESCVDSTIAGVVEDAHSSYPKDVILLEVSSKGLEDDIESQQKAALLADHNHDSSDRGVTRSKNDSSDRGVTRSKNDSSDMSVTRSLVLDEDASITTGRMNKAANVNEKDVASKGKTANSTIRMSKTEAQSIRMSKTDPGPWLMAFNFRVRFMISGLMQLIGCILFASALVGYIPGLLCYFVGCILIAAGNSWWVGAWIGMKFFFVARIASYYLNSWWV